MHAMSPYYTAVEKFLAENGIQYTPKLIDFPVIEKGAAKALARNLSSHRKSLHLSQTNMARMLGISLSQYKKYESGIEILRLDLAQKWSLRFSMPVFHLLQGSGYAANPAHVDANGRLGFLWFLANSLNDDYFRKLADMLCLFAQQPRAWMAPEPSGITRDYVNSVIEEIESTTYIAIAYGMQAIRKWFGASQEQFAELMGVSLSTYQQYEKPTMNPRFNLFVAARCVMSMGINPLVAIAGTRFAKVRLMQDARMTLIREIVADIDPQRLAGLQPLGKGFAEMVKYVPGALIVDV
jgi:transcriptional regulator with XRE-family HTH domain